MVQVPVVIERREVISAVGGFCRLMVSELEI